METHAEHTEININASNSQIIQETNLPHKAAQFREYLKKLHGLSFLTNDVYDECLPKLWELIANFEKSITKENGFLLENPADKKPHLKRKRTTLPMRKKLDRFRNRHGESAQRAKASATDLRINPLDVEPKKNKRRF